MTVLVFGGELDKAVHRDAHPSFGMLAVDLGVSIGHFFAVEPFDLLGVASDIFGLFPLVVNGPAFNAVGLSIARSAVPSVVFPVKIR